MSLSYHRAVVSLSCVFLLMACESDESKLIRLRGDMGSSCLLAEAADRAYTQARYPGGMTVENVSIPATHRADSLGREYMDRKTECDLATRAYNRFMR